MGFLDTIKGWFGMSEDAAGDVGESTADGAGDAFEAVKDQAEDVVDSVKDKSDGDDDEPGEGAGE